MKKRMLRCFYLSFGCLLLVIQAMAAPRIPYIPQVVNYSVGEYKAGNQNWAVAQGADGLMYFGNNRGLLQFDGTRWTLYPLPTNLAVRSIYIDSNNRIYVGSFEEFGYFEANPQNKLVYTSLKAKVKDFSFMNDEVWTIHQKDKNIFFQCFGSYFVFNGKEVKGVRPQRGPLYFHKVNNNMYSSLLGSGFCFFDGINQKEVVPGTALNRDDVVAVLPMDNKLLLLTDSHGLFLYDGFKAVPWQTEADLFLKRSTMNRAVMTSDSLYILGSVSDGLVALDKTARMVWHINRENHLINNTVLGLACDKQNNVWIALDNGIAQIQTSSSFDFYEPLDVQIGMVHDMVRKDNFLYLVSNQGAYSIADESQSPVILPNSKGQNWYIEDLDGQLFCGNNKGTLQIQNKEASFFPGAESGGTAIRKCTIHGKEILLQSSYSVLSVFTKDVAGKWRFSHNIKGFSNLIKRLEVDPAGNIWANHMYKGVYRIQLNATLDSVKELEYITNPDSTRKESALNVMMLRGRVVITDGYQFYMYEDLSQKVVPFNELNNQFKGMGDTYRIVPVNNDLYWFIRSSEYVLVSFENGRYEAKARIPFGLFDNPPIEDRGNIYVDEAGISYFCLNGGIARYNKGKQLPQSHVSLLLSSVRVYNRHKETYQFLPVSGFASLDYSFNNIQFAFSYPNFLGKEFRMQYKLEGFDTNWVDGAADFTKDYSNLPYGSYVLHAKVVNNVGEVLASSSYEFEISRPFYRSYIAFGVYFILIILLLIAIIKAYITWEINRENKAIEQEKKEREEQLKAQEQLIIKLQNEKLEDELTYKSKELASATLSVISHNDFLEALKKEVQMQQLSGTYSKKYFEKLIRMIDENLSSEDAWLVFQHNFDRIHENFFRSLRTHYPDLTPGDLRLCALLRLNMPTKDMARMQNLSVRGVEAARYRLRKKLDIPEGKSLVDFMIEFK